MITHLTSEQIATISKQDDTIIIIAQYAWLVVVLFLISAIRLHWELKRPAQHLKNPIKWPILKWYEVQWWAWGGLSLTEGFYGYRNYHFTFDHGMSYTSDDSMLNLWGTTARVFCITWISLPYMAHYWIWFCAHYRAGCKRLKTLRK